METNKKEREKVSVTECIDSAIFYLPCIVLHYPAIAIRD